MTQKGEDFVRIFKCYMLLGLAGGLAQVPLKAYEELDMACDDLLAALNPEPEELKESHKVFITRPSSLIGGSYFVCHDKTAHIIGYHQDEQAADKACKWLNERYDS